MVGDDLTGAMHDVALRLSWLLLPSTGAAAKSRFDILVPASRGSPGNRPLWRMVVVYCVLTQTAQHGSAAMCWMRYFKSVEINWHRL